jgi:hypothetical protein
MRTMVLMAAFGLGCVFLMPRPARSLDDCKACKCVTMKAWQNVCLPTGTFGLRLPDPMDPENWVEVDHVPYKDPAGNDIHWLAVAEEQGERTLQVDGKGNPIMGKFSLVRATFANKADWGNYKWWNGGGPSTITQQHALCQPNDGAPPIE